MKLILSILLLACVSAQSAYVTVSVTFTNRTQVGNNFTNGLRVVYWTNNPLNSVNWLTTNSPSISATSFARYFGAQFPQYYTRQTNATNVTISGNDIQFGIGGAYALVTTNSATVTNGWIVTLPFVNQYDTNRTNTASELVSGMSQYSTNAFATNSPALANHLSLGPQTQTFSNKISLNNTQVNGYQTNVAIVNSTFGGGSITGAVDASTATIADVPSLSRSNTWNGTNYFRTIIITNGSSVIVGATNFAPSLLNGLNVQGHGVSANLGMYEYANDSATLAPIISMFRYRGNLALNSNVMAGDTLGGIQVWGGRADNSVIPYQAFAMAIKSAVDWTTSGSGTNTAYVQFSVGTVGGSLATPFEFTPYAITNRGDVYFSSNILSAGIASFGSVSNSLFTGTNVWSGSVIYTPASNSALVNGFNSGIVLGTNVYIQLSGPSGAYTNVGFAAEPTGSYHIVRMDNPASSIAIRNASGLEATAANRVTTCTGGELVLTNNPAYIRVVYNGSSWEITDHSR